MPSSWCRGLSACLVSFSLAACATVPVPDKSYIARAKIGGASEPVQINEGPPLAEELKKKGVLVQGGKIAVLPTYECRLGATRNCFSEIDRLELALKDAGFWVEHWRDLITDDPDAPFQKVRARGIDHVILVDSHELRAEAAKALFVSGLSLIEQREAAKPQPLQIKNEEWEIVAPRCIKHFSRALPLEPQAPVAAMSLRLISVDEERVMWTRKFEQRGAVSAPTLELHHDVPKQVRSNKAQRNWGIGIASVGAGLGVGAAVSAGRSSIGTTLILAGAALISGGLGAWLVYDSRPRESHAQEPVDVLCTPEFTKPKRAKDSETSSQFIVSKSSSGGSPDLAQLALGRAKRLETAMINDAANSLSLLKRREWAKPKKKNKDKKKKSKGEKKEDDRVSALACRWEEQELRCRAACTRCKDPWEGPCEICRPPKEGELASIPVPPKGLEGKGKKDKGQKGKGDAPAVVAAQVDGGERRRAAAKSAFSKKRGAGHQDKAAAKGEGSKGKPKAEEKGGPQRGASAAKSKSPEGKSKSPADPPLSNSKESSEKSGVPEEKTRESDATSKSKKKEQKSKPPAGSTSASEGKSKSSAPAEGKSEKPSTQAPAEGGGAGKSKRSKPEKKEQKSKPPAGSTSASEGKSKSSAPAEGESEKPSTQAPAEGGGAGKGKRSKSKKNKKKSKS